MNIWVKIIPILLFFFLTPVIAEARSGCCSWHGGVCGCDTSVGRQVCCDGSYSPSCGCTYIAPKPTFPQNTQASWNWYPNSNKTFNLSVDLDDSNPTQYSAVVNKCAGCDPGPLTDFYSNSFYYTNLKPGNYYLNVKKLINGYWSNTVYWTINIPAWYTPSPTPTPTTPVYTSNTTSKKDTPNDSWLGWLLISGLGYGIYKLFTYKS